MKNFIILGMVCIMAMIQYKMVLATPFSYLESSTLEPSLQEQMTGLSMPQNQTIPGQNPSNFQEDSQSNQNSGTQPDFDQYIPETPEVATQEDVIQFIRNAVSNRFGNTLYQETESIGDLIMIVQQPLLYTQKNIEFIVIPYHINKEYDFSQAEFRWRILRGDEELTKVIAVNKPLYFYTFTEPGVYQAEVEIQINPDTTLRSTLAFSIYDEVPILVNPETPSQGDMITVTPEYSGTNTIFEWTVDGEKINNFAKELTFQEFKGVGGTYAIQVKILTREDRAIVGAGSTVIEIPAPRILLQLFNDETGERIPITAQTIIEKPMRVRVEVTSEFFSPNARLSTALRLDNKPIRDADKQFVFDVNPESQYRIDVIVNDERSTALARRDLIINPHLEAENSSTKMNAGLSGNVNKGMVLQRYLGLGMFILIIGIGFFMSRQGRHISI